MTKHKRQLAIRPKMVTETQYQQGIQAIREGYEIQLETFRDEASRLLALQRAAFDFMRELVFIQSQVAPGISGHQVETALQGHDTILLATINELENAVIAARDLPGSEGRESGFLYAREVAAAHHDAMKELKQSAHPAGRLRDVVIKYAPPIILEAFGRITDLGRGRTPEAWRPALAEAWREMQKQHGERPVYLEWRDMLAQYESNNEVEPEALEFLRKTRTDKQKYDQRRYLLR